MRHDGIRLIVSTQSPTALGKNTDRQSLQNLHHTLKLNVPLITTCNTPSPPPPCTSSSISLLLPSAPELLELVTVSVLHRFHSKDWHAYLEKKLPLSKESWDLLLSLSPGQALVFASRQQVFPPAMSLVVAQEGIHSVLSSNNKWSSEIFVYGPNCLVIQIRPRFTADRGASVRNKKKVKVVTKLEEK